MKTSIPHGFEPLDPGRVNTMDPVELAYWCAQFGCDEDRLQGAIDAVGEHVTAVRDWLAQQRGG
jgi:hypothetical protein